MLASTQQGITHDNRSNIAVIYYALTEYWDALSTASEDILLKARIMSC